MICELKVRTRSRSYEEAEAEIETFVNHARMAGVLEGIAPESSRWTDNHFERATLMDEWWDRGLPIIGRATITFDAEGPHDEGVAQVGYAVIGSQENWFTTPLPPGADRPESGRDVTGEVLVLQRVRPATRKLNDDGELGGELLVAGKLTAEDLEAFTRLALADEVTHISYGRARSRPGYEIEMGYLVDVPSAATGNAANTSMGFGGMEVVYGDTLLDAVTLAAAKLEQARSRTFFK